MQIEVDAPAGTAKFTIIYPNGEVIEENRDPNNKPTLAELQGAVEGLIESVDRFVIRPGVEAYANEEGRFRDWAPNTKGMELIDWPSNALPIVGPIVILEGFNPDDDDADVDSGSGQQPDGMGGLLG